VYQGKGEDTRGGGAGGPQHRQGTSMIERPKEKNRKKISKKEEKTLEGEGICTVRSWKPTGEAVGHRKQTGGEKLPVKKLLRGGRKGVSPPRLNQYLNKGKEKQKKGGKGECQQGSGGFSRAWGCSAARPSSETRGGGVEEPLTKKSLNFWGLPQMERTGFFCRGEGTKVPPTHLWLRKKTGGETAQSFLFRGSQQRGGR